MTSRVNSFALLGDDDEGDDVSVLLARAAEAAKIDAPPPADGDQKLKRKNEKGTKPPPPAVRSASERGRGVRSSGFASGGTEAEHFRHQQSYRGSENSQWDNAGVRRNPRSSGGGSNWNANDDGTQGRGRRNGRSGQGVPRGGRTQGRGFGEDQGPRNGSHGFVANNHPEITENAHQDDGADGGWLQVSQYRNRSEGRYQRNHERNWASSESRGYDIGDRGYRAREGSSYGGPDGRNHEEGGQFNNFQVTEEIRNINDNNNNSYSGWDDPVSTEIVKDLEPVQGELGDVDKQESSEKNTEEENSEIIKEDQSGKKTKEEIEKMKEGTEKNTREEELEIKRKEEEEEAKEMTLEEYEKLLLEKRKALESLKTKERRVTLDKDFESMQLIEKKKEDNLSTKLKPEKDKLKKKDNVDKEEKARKALSINEFLKPAEGKSYRGHGRRGRGRGENGGYGGGRGENRGSSGGGPGRGLPNQNGNSELQIQDDVQFPGLPAASGA